MYSGKSCDDNICIKVINVRIKNALSVYMLIVPIALCLHNDPVIAYLDHYISHLVMGILSQCE